MYPKRRSCVTAVKKIEFGAKFFQGRGIFGHAVLFEEAIGLITGEAECLREREMRKLVLTIAFNEQGFLGGEIEVAQFAAQALFDGGG